jgi:hypothetical protein
VSTLGPGEAAWLTDVTADWFWPAAEGSLACHVSHVGCSPVSPSDTRNLCSSLTTWGSVRVFALVLIHGIPQKQQGAGSYCPVGRDRKISER